MLRDALVSRVGETMGGFRVRGREVSRIEGFSDAAFAFAITLLVVSLEVPDSFEKLVDVMRGLPAFAVCFATIMWLWVAHYKFFRRFGVQDRLTIALNSALLFVVMFYVYPLKFMFTIFLGMLTGVQPSGTGRIAQQQVDELFVIYGLGFVAVFWLLGLMNIRAYRLRSELELNELECLLTRAEIARLLCVGAVGAVSVSLAVTLSGWYVGLAGLAYCLIGVVEFVVGWRFGRKADKVRQSMAGSAVVT